jgi:cytochrome c peroxidase
MTARGAAVAGAVLVAVAAATAGLATVRAGGHEGDAQRDCHGPVCADIAHGRKAFRDRALHGLPGNGRSCADCHMPEDGTFQLSPAQAQARFERLMARRQRDENADDPLFRAIDADDFRVNGDAASDYSNLTQLGLVRVTLPLPANVRLIDPVTNQPSAETVADVWRTVPPLLNLAITGADGLPPFATRGPNPTGGYQLDGREANLQDQALGAMRAHMGIEDPVPDAVLDHLAAFQSALFSSDGVRELAAAMESGAALPDPDPELTPLEAEGKAVFVRACGQCHGNDGSHPSQSTPIEHALPGVAAITRYHLIRNTCPRAPGFGFAACAPQMMKNVRTYEVTVGTTTQRITTSDPGRALLTGNPADFGVFDVPQLRGLSRTAPYFHNNSAATLEEMLDHYDAFFRAVKSVNPRAPILTTNGVDHDRPATPAEREALLAYLKKL